MEIEILHRDAGCEWRRGLCSIAPLLERQQRILRVRPGDRRHGGGWPALERQMIDAAIGRDDEVGAQAGRERLHQDVGARAFSRAAAGIADRPADGVASGNRIDRLARLKRNIGDALRGRIEAVKHALSKGIGLDRVEVARTRRLEQSSAVRRIDGRRRLRRRRYCQHEQAYWGGEISDHSMFLSSGSGSGGPARLGSSGEPSGMFDGIEICG